MITVFGSPPTRAMRVVWTLEEMGLPYEIHPVDFRNRHKDREFMAINPAGFLPAITHGDVHMFESVAIVDYLSRKYGPTPLCPAQSDPNWPLYLQFLHFGEASLAGPMNVTMGSRFFAPDEQKENYGATLAIDMALGRAKLLVNQLKKTPYLAGEEFTAADISCSYFLAFADFLGFADRVNPVLTDYQDRLRARPAYQRAAAKNPAAAGK